MTPTDTTLYLLSVLTTLCWVYEAWRNRQLRQVRDELNMRHTLLMDDLKQVQTTLNAELAKSVDLQRQVEEAVKQAQRDGASMRHWQHQYIELAAAQVKGGVK